MGVTTDGMLDMVVVVIHCEYGAYSPDLHDVVLAIHQKTLNDSRTLIQNSHTIASLFALKTNNIQDTNASRVEMIHIQIQDSRYYSSWKTNRDETDELIPHEILTARKRIFRETPRSQKDAFSVQVYTFYGEHKTNLVETYDVCTKWKRSY